MDKRDCDKNGCVMYREGWSRCEWGYCVERYRTPSNSDAAPPRPHLDQVPYAVQGCMYGSSMARWSAADSDAPDHAYPGYDTGEPPPDDPAEEFEEADPYCEDPPPEHNDCILWRCALCGYKYWTPQGFIGPALCAGDRDQHSQEPMEPVGDRTEWAVGDHALVRGHGALRLEVSHAPAPDASSNDSPVPIGGGPDGWVHATYGDSALGISDAFIALCTAHGMPCADPGQEHYCLADDAPAVVTLCLEPCATYVTQDGAPGCPCAAYDRSFRHTDATPDPP